MMREQKTINSPKIKISKFPIFTKLTLDEMFIVAAEARASIPRMDSAPAILVSFFNYENKLVFSRLNSNLLIKYFDPNINQINFEIYGTNNLVNSIFKLFEYQKIEGLKQVITYLDEEQSSVLLKSNNFIIKPMDEAFEYIIKTADHAYLADRRLKDEAMHIRSFIRRYGENIKIFEVDLSKLKNVYNILNAWDSWGKQFKNNNNDPDSEERKQIKLFLENVNNLPTKCIALIYLDQIVGFTFYDLFEEYSCAVGHFMKVDYTYSHIFDFLLHALCSKLHTENVKYINIEGDLGIPGIRYKKQSLLPVKILKFYSAESKVIYN
jgi:hypothetical protein